MRGAIESGSVPVSVTMLPVHFVYLSLAIVLLRSGRPKKPQRPNADSARRWSASLMGKLSRHVGKTIFGSIAVALLVLVGLDSVGAIIDQTADISRNYHFVDVLIYVGTLMPSRIYEYMPFASLIGCLIGLGLLATNSEVIVMRAAGVSPLRIVGFVLQAGDAVYYAVDGYRRVFFALSGSAGRGPPRLSS